MTRLVDITPYLCHADATTRDALARLNATDHLFQLITDHDGKLLGTLTDGDIRRAMLAGSTLDEPVSRCLHRNPLVGRMGEDATNKEKLRKIGGYKAFLPVIDAEGRVHEVFVAGMPSDAAVKTALVMAGGRGTRLGERTKDTPKPLLNVGDRPILEHVLTALENAGVPEIFVSVHYLADQIEAFVSARSARAQVRTVREGEQRGTIGALGQLPQPLGGAVLVVNGDVISGVDFNAMAAFHARHGYDATIGVARHEIDIPFGVIRHTSDGLFERIDEKPRIGHFVAGGIYLLGPEFAALVPVDRPMDMPELLNEGRTLGLSIGLFPIHEYWRDIGQPHDLAAAERDHKL
ncbi:MAG: sugar phosphate nucleotidyltransferase [Alphaproteobacteria bacterium]